MKKYIFETFTTTKDYDAKRWWIDPKIVTRKYIKAENLKEALKIFQKMVEEEHYVTISDSALKTKAAMYHDTADGTPEQVGYVITGRTTFYGDDGRTNLRYLDLWVTILTVVDTEF